jgi:hypothetical protein
MLRKLQHARQAFVEPPGFRFGKPGHGVEQTVDEVLVRLCLGIQGGTGRAWDVAASGFDGDDLAEPARRKRSSIK